MFKKFKDRLTEVSEEVKRDPRFANSLASVNQFAQNTYLSLNKNEKNGSRESLTSQNSLAPSFAQLQQFDVDHPGAGIVNEEGPSGHKRSQSSDLQSFFNSDFNDTRTKSRGLSASASSPSLATTMAVAGNSFFSLTEEDDSVLSGANSPAKSNNNNFSSVDLSTGYQPPGSGGDHMASSPGHRLRKLSSGSMTTEAANLFPIYEAPQQVYNLPATDLDSTAGSEWDEDASSQHLSAITKEQLFQMLQKARARYHKYKGRYTDVARAFQDLEKENSKIKTVMHQTQDKALRRISELKEQCQLEQKAKRHLEEELRSDLEEKEHVIEALQTKVTLLKNGGKGVIDDNAATEGDASPNLVDLSSDAISIDVTENNLPVIKRDTEKIAALEGKIKRLEELLTKCKESIKANKQKTTALTEVKESLAKQVSEREIESEDLRSQLLSTQATLTSAQKEIEGHRKREQQEELQIAENKMMMHQEIITKDEEIGKLRSNLKHTNEALEEKFIDIERLKDEIDLVKKQQLALEKSLESEKATALQEMSRGKSSALQALQADMEKRISEISTKHEQDKGALKEQLDKETEEKLRAAEREKQRELKLKEEQMQKQIQEKEEEGRLAFEELELRVSSISAGDDSKSKLLRDLETKLKEVGAEKKHLQTELLRIKEELNSVCSEIKIELKEELETLKENNRQVQINLERATEKLVKNEDEKKQLVNKVKDLNTQINEYESCKEVLEKNEREYNDKIEAIKAQLVTVEHENEQLKKSIKDKESTLSEIHGKTSVLEQEMEEKVKNIEIMRVDHQKVLASLQDQMQNADNSDEATKHFETRMEILKLEHDHKIQTLDEEIIELKANYEKAILEFESKSELAAKSIAEKETQIEVLTSSISRIEQDQESLNEITNDLNKELVAANEIIASKDQELDNFDQKIEAISKSNIVEVTTIKDEIISMSKKLEDKTNSYKKLEETLQAENKKARQLDHDLEETRQVLAFVSDDHVHFEEAAKKKANELEKEVLDLRNREGSLKGHEQQLIAYQKELQDQITNGEEKESNLAKEIKDLKLDLQDRENQFKEMTKKNNDEILQLKADFELKIRHKKEKETSFKELQMQSIDYQKKLQEQLTVMEHDLEEAKVKAIGHTTEVNKLSSRIQNLNQDLALSYDEKVKMADNISSLQSEIQTLNNDLQDTKVELSNATKSANEKTNAILVENEQLLDKIASLEVSQDSSEQQLVKKILEEKSDELANQKTNHDNELKTLASNLEETAHKMVNEMTNLWLEKEKKWKLQLDSSEDHTSKTVAELEDLKDKLELTNQMMYNAQNMASAKDAEIEELRSSLRINNDDMEGLKKDLKNSQSDKAAQLLEFEDTLVYLEKQVAELKSRNDEYQNQLESQSRKIEDDKDLNAIHVQIENSHEQAVKALIRKYETQIATKEEAFDTESARIRDEAETELRRTMSDFSGQVADLRKELYEKTALYDDLIDRHQAELRAKQDEVDEEVEACNRMYQVKISEVQAEHEIKIKEFEEKQSSNAEDKKSWNWERATSIDEDAVEDLQRTPTREQRQVQLRQTSLSPPPATLAVSSVMTVNDNSQQHCNHTHSLEEATEFEYLKNVLYQYMMGKEAMTLARVLTTVVKFSPDEQQEVIKHEENKQSLFSNLGILPA